MTDIHELFARDPLSLSQQDLETIIQKFRDSRHQFIAGNIKAGNTKAPSAKAQASLDLGKKIGLDLGDL